MFSNKGLWNIWFMTNYLLALLITGRPVTLGQHKNAKDRTGLSSGRKGFISLFHTKPRNTVCGKMELPLHALV